MIFKIKKNKFSKRIKKALWGHSLIKGKNFNLRYYFLLLKKESYNRRKKGLRYDEKKKFIYNKRLTKYGQILLSRKKLCNFYCLKLKQFKYFCILAEKNNNNNFINNLVGLLEKRLVTIVFRMNFVFSMLESYNKIKSGFFLVNKKIILNPNFIIAIGDIIEINYVYKHLIYNNLLLRCNKVFKKNQNKAFLFLHQPQNILNKSILKNKNKRLFIYKKNKYFYFYIWLKNLLNKKKLRYIINDESNVALRLLYKKKKIKSIFSVLYNRIFRNSHLGKNKFIDLGFSYIFRYPFHKKYKGFYKKNNKKINKHVAKFSTRYYIIKRSRLGTKFIRTCNSASKTKNGRKAKLQANASTFSGNNGKRVMAGKSFRSTQIRKGWLFKRGRSIKSSNASNDTTKIFLSCRTILRTLGNFNNILVVYNRYYNGKRFFLTRPFRLYRRDYLIKKYKYIKELYIKYYYLNLKIKSIIYKIYIYNKNINNSIFKNFKNFKIFKKSFLYKIFYKVIYKMLNLYWKKKLNYYINIYNNLSFRFIKKLKKNKIFKFRKYFGKDFLFRQQHFLKFLNIKTKKLINHKYLFKAGTEKVLKNNEVKISMKKKMSFSFNKLKKNYWLINNYSRYVFVNYILLVGCLIKEPEIFDVFYPFYSRFSKDRKRYKESNDIIRRFKKKKKELGIDSSVGHTHLYLKDIYIKNCYKKSAKIIYKRKNKKNSFKINRNSILNYIKKKNSFIINRAFNKTYKYKYMYHLLKNKLIKKLKKREKAFSGAGFFNRFF
jgi:ribosomal protein S4